MTALGNPSAPSNRLTALPSPLTLNPMNESAPREDAATPTGTALNARITISLYESNFEGGDLIPIIEVSPAGRMTHGALERLLPLVYREISTAQAKKARADELAMKELTNVAE